MTSLDGRIFAATLVVALALGACASSSSPRATDAGATDRTPANALPPPDVAAPGLDETALLLLLIDRQLYEPFSIDRLSGDGRPEVRVELATALARVPDQRAVEVLDRLATDPDPRVRRATAFAAARVGAGLGVKEALTLLDLFLLDADDETAAWACHGLARAGIQLDRVVGRLGALERERRQARLLPDLHLFATGAGRTTYEAIALEGLTAADVGLRRRALLALVASARAPQRPVFARLLADADAGMRSLAAAGLARVGTADDLEALRAASGDADLGVAVAALDAGAAIVRAGRAAGPAAWRATLLERLDDPRAAVRAAADSAAAAWLLDPELETALAVRAREAAAPGERARALAALADARAQGAADLTVAAAGDRDAWRRAAAARAAGSLEATALLDQLAADASPLVRAAAFNAKARLDARARPDLYTRFLADPDPAVRLAVVDRLVGAPVVPFEPILTAFAKDERAAPELALAGVAALRARAETTPTERGSIVAALEGLTEVATYPVRVAAAGALVELGRPRPPIGSANTARSPRDYRSMVAQTRRPRWVRIETAGGAAVVRLDSSEAPLQTLAFLKLAEQGFYDGTAVYRVVPGGRVEAGDPGGDGHGGPGFTLRDEPGPRRLGAGAFGLVRPAPHAAGSRFFVQLGVAPEAEGEVTRLGEVVSGLDVLAGLLEGDRIASLREVPAPAELHSGPAGRDDR
jgi:cyclophilin family peptidyl-prolyl cis-trans isomerase